MQPVAIVLYDDEDETTIQYIQRARKALANASILVVGKGDTVRKVKAILTGADIYLTDVSVNELTARIRSMMRSRGCL